MTTGSGAMAGRSALVTGASKGIGRDLALGLAAAGASVMVNYKTDAHGAEEVCRQIAESGVAQRLGGRPWRGRFAQDPRKRRRRRSPRRRCPW